MNTFALYYVPFERPCKVYHFKIQWTFMHNWKDSIRSKLLNVPAGRLMGLKPLCIGSSCKASQREFLHVFVNYFHGQMTLNTMCRSRVSTSVNSIMFQQTRLIYKQLCTFEAAGGFFASVNSHMCHQWFLYQETIWCFFQLIFRP